jgi:hypothetical protein
MARARGAKPSPRHRLAGATPHRIVGETPAQYFWRVAQLSMWLNDVDGDCVTAEEAFKDGCSPGVFITDDTVRAWATANGFLNGADLITVLDLMQTNGFQQDGQTFGDGPPLSVDWTNADILHNAIVQGPVKIGIAADQLDKVVPNPPTNGWVAQGFQPDSNEDHCVSLSGFGPIYWLLEQIGAPLPDGVDGTLPGLAMFTWKSIGVIDVPSMLAITGEAWLRVPNFVMKG